MVLTNAGNAVIATTTEVRRNLKNVLEQAREKRVLVTSDGELVGGIVSPEMLEILDEALSDAYLVSVAEERFRALEEGRDELIDADEFWARFGV
jgi:PHD/YefM family antitoxin component YafN of YafNO toxin-antitoxin module